MSDLTRGDRYEVELLLAELSLDEAGGLLPAAMESDGAEAVRLYEGYVGRGLRELWTWLGIFDEVDCEYL